MLQFIDNPTVGINHKIIVFLALFFSPLQFGNYLFFLLSLFRKEVLFFKEFLIINFSYFFLREASPYKPSSA